MPNTEAVVSKAMSAARCDGIGLQQHTGTGALRNTQKHTAAHIWNEGSARQDQEEGYGPGQGQGHTHVGPKHAQLKNALRRNNTQTGGHGMVSDLRAATTPWKDMIRPTATTDAHVYSIRYLHMHPYSVHHTAIIHNPNWMMRASL